MPIAKKSTPKAEWNPAAIDPNDAPRAVREYLETLDDAAFGAASTATPKFISHSDPAPQWTGARGGTAYFAYSTNDLIDMDNAVIMDIEPTRSIQQAEVGAVRTMIDRVQETHDIKPERFIAGTLLPKRASTQSDKIGLRDIPRCRPGSGPNQAVQRLM